MLFFVKGESTGMPPMPPDQVYELVVKEWETIISYKQQGKILAGGAMAGRRGGCVIFDVDSSDELHTLISQLPLFPFIAWEIIPLISAESALERAKQTLEELQGAKE
jgi:muconolactone D-isomerase